MPEPLIRHVRVFLCHSSKDQPIARELYRQLKAEEWMSVWFIEANLLPSQDWAFEIRRAAQSSEVLIFLHSKHSIEKEETAYPDINFVLDILHKKPKRSIPIIVIRLDDFRVSMNLKTICVIDYFPRYRRRSPYQNLLECLRSCADQPDSSIINQETRTEPDKFLQWSPANWRNLTFENGADPLDDQLSVSTPSYFSPKMERKIFSRTNKLGTNHWIMIGLLTLLIFWSVRDYLAIDHSVQSTLSLPTPTLGIGSIHTSPKDGMKMVYVPAGDFMMGGEVYYDERPIHRVNIDAFWIDQTEVTHVKFAAFLTEEGNREEGGILWLDSQDEDTYIHLEEDSWQADQGYEDHPVVEVTWYGANAYCSWAGRRLPTEAEWEKAARWKPSSDGNGQGEALTYPWGNNDPTADVLNFDDNIGDTTKVGSYPNGASPYGALDMAGNVWEWVADRHSRNYYAISPPDNPKGPETGFFRVLRGGAWNYRDTYARSMHRNRGIPTISHDFIGFRCASDVSP